MTCTWCPNEATEGGQLPPNAKGKRFWYACAAHKYLLKSLRLVPITPAEINQILKREAKDAKAGG